MSNRVTKQSTGGGGGVPLSDFKTNIAPVETVDGVNKVFTIPDNYTNLTIYADGQTQLDATDYTLSGTGNKTVTFEDAPTQWVRFNYIKQ